VRSASSSALAERPLRDEPGDTLLSVPVSPPFPVAAIVFDLDGLLVDSEGRWGEAEEEVVASFARPWDPAIRTLLLGKGPREAALALGAYLGGVDPDEVERRMLSAALSAFAKGIPVMPGAMDLVHAVRGRVPIAVATNSLRVLTERALTSAGLDGLVDAVVCVEDVSLPKPAPDPYATACRILGVDPTVAVAFEDSPVGMRSATLAGMWVIACPSFPSTPTDDADAVVASLEEIDADVLLTGRAPASA
jgi:HAD superfamily hydrolase (TIGR01509 family)